MHSKTSKIIWRVKWYFFFHGIVECEKDFDYIDDARIKIKELREDNKTFGGITTWHNKGIRLERIEIM